jgi:hypothetical protein
MKTLHLNLKRKWFDMFLQEIKKDEYRAIKLHNVSLLFDWKQSGMSRETFTRSLIEDDHFLKAYAQELLKEYDAICFSNGYAKNRDQFVIELNGVAIIKEGKPEWGATPGEKTFALRTGEILSGNVMGYEF